MPFLWLICDCSDYDVVPCQSNARVVLRRRAGADIDCSRSDALLPIFRLTDCCSCAAEQRYSAAAT
jgi:hypothetical protein